MVLARDFVVTPAPGDGVSLCWSVKLSTFTPRRPAKRALDLRYVLLELDLEAAEREAREKTEPYPIFASQDES